MFTALFLCGLCGPLNAQVLITHNQSEQKVDVVVNGAYFTSYVYDGTELKKPVLFPVLSASGQTITRGFPIAPRAGERIDHTHHFGIWFNHGDVNGIDFWNAGRTPPKPGVRYGQIKHKSVLESSSGAVGTLVVAKDWIDDNGQVLLEETTHYEFSGDIHRRVLTHTTTVTASNQDIVFHDSKEGLFAIRVARELEIASAKPAILLDLNLKETNEALLDNSQVSGRYLNSRGLEGYPEVWGKRASWMKLSGFVEREPISILIFDSPENINHPPHWMARDYGLFAVNNLGSGVYTEGKENLNFRLNKSEQRTFRNQLIITSGLTLDDATINTWFEEFVGMPW
ncbi:hypothetical protein GCM10008090_33340 [Arenicella chitinivorans]|uniref:Methane oxygenase PmoA n=2 Tax=Arenicella chitinivorans TaxID=1329800 RepID=A0A918S4B1_9GAMM|nr:hypothetical protein GCM10008090_33340 [Arenicella chitinivorans]